MKVQTLLEHRRSDASDKYDPLFRHPPPFYGAVRLQNYNLATLDSSPAPTRKTQRPGSTQITQRRPSTRDESPLRSIPKPSTTTQGTQAFRINRRHQTPVRQVNASPTPLLKNYRTLVDGETSRPNLFERTTRDTSPDKFFVEGTRTRASPFLKETSNLRILRMGMMMNSDESLAKILGEKEPDYFIYAVGKGNNDQVVKRVMQRRYWWKETYSANSIFHFSWQQSTKATMYEKISSMKGKQIVNHFEFNSELTTKINLIKNLQLYCEKAYTELFDITPTTFILDLQDPNFQTHFQEFLMFFTNNSKITSDHNSQISSIFAQYNIKPKAILGNNNNMPVRLLFSQAKMHDSFYNGSNLWLLKPTEYNRGRGINLFNKLSSLEYYLKCFLVGDNVNRYKTMSGTGRKFRDQALNLVQSHKFVLQKYVEKPMLIEGRKFDIRVWALVDHNMNLYYFREGYIRLSSEVFSLNEDTIEDVYVHLTNNAIQKEGKNYGKHESGNILSLQQLKDYLPKERAKSEYLKIVDKIKDQIKTSMKSIRDKLNAKERKYCFEIFGYDFIIDANYNVWLIEVNCNPCIEESNDLLKRLVPRMLDDAFKLTIDKIMIPTPKNFKPEDVKRAEAIPPFSVNGYDNNQNIWEHLANLRAVQIYAKINHTKS